MHIACPLQFTLWRCASRRKWEVGNQHCWKCGRIQQSGEDEIENEGIKE